MHPDIQARFQQLESRRKAMTERVRALPSVRQTMRPSPREFSPVEVLMHMALSERHDLNQLNAGSATILSMRRPKTSFIYRQAVNRMLNARRMGTLAAMIPSPGVTLVQADEAWEDVRAGLARHFVKMPSPDTPMIVLRFMGVLSASDLLTLIEAHTHYHEALFPEV